ncbi:D-lactate dehydrogenase [Motiliproteus coralliicola]|uniref:Quinone-dependent D-lactate dehydrogenase n=1 Tax=Motiliproteus coralliicola TaxID=2283196 RepID=A0A369WLG5_9GAMM|nr:D-lactate dehydrogenase [Motiliproteus coralliicola]RDE22918.1 D-lactate dehydrogenase [Motiliproteus coralliicola]
MNNEALIATLTDIVGTKYCITGDKKSERFRKGFRSGEGQALCVVKPGTLLEQWKILQACVAADKIVIFQAANTGLTEGSTPKSSYSRDVVVINTMRMDAIHCLQGGNQVLSFPGATLFALERLLRPLKRLPHSVIGSSSIGASILGGVCNNSGGALCERGPAYTELALYAQVGEDGKLRLVNHLGIELGDTPEEILMRLEAGDYDKDSAAPAGKKASDTDYDAILRDVESPLPSRYNNDDRLLHEVSGCAGKLAVFAIRLDTYPQNEEERTYYIGTNNPDDITELRRRILTEFETLPVSAEYVHRECFDIAAEYGKDTLVMIDKLGTDRLPAVFVLKGAVDARLNKFSLTRGFTDKFMQFAMRLWPQHLPKFMRDYRDRFEHHLILKMHDGGIAEAEKLLPELFEGRDDADFMACTPREAKIAGLHRFAAAGAAVRYGHVHADQVEDILALDIALPRNDLNWREQLPKEITDKLVAKVYYGHMMCHVFHHDYIVKKGVDVKALKAEMLKLLDQRGIEYPAEHNVGHLYVAKEDLATHYKDCDPTNSFNPGIGRMSREKYYA